MFLYQLQAQHSFLQFWGFFDHASIQFFKVIIKTYCLNKSKYLFYFCFFFSFLGSVEITEANLVRDVLYVFQGIDGKNIKMCNSENCYKVEGKVLYDDLYFICEQKSMQGKNSCEKHVKKLKYDEYQSVFPLPAVLFCFVLVLFVFFLGVLLLIQQSSFNISS